ncbi:hypothetical protein [Actinomadura sp. GTD37]|uniref:hypothetical protein n=1 Tax=Actinomadura sp. GTD37 TaxID=1778030 RepID=UPI0035C080A8
MIFGRGRPKRGEPSTDAGGVLDAKFQELQKVQENLLAELAETQQKVADAGSARRRIEEQMKDLETRREALSADEEKAARDGRLDVAEQVREQIARLASEVENVEDRYQQATMSEKRLIGDEGAMRKQADELSALKASIEDHARQLKSMLQTD